MTTTSESQNEIPNQPAPKGDLTVNAPIVLNARTAEGVQDFIQYVEALGSHGAVAAAAAESQRLQPYFSAMNTYLAKTLGNADAAKEFEVSRESLAAAVAPEGLSALFNAMASLTHSTMISDVVILPDNIKSEGPAAAIFSGHGEFDANYNYGGRRFNFGFYQAYEGGERRAAMGSTTFPTLTLDHQMMDSLPKSEAEPLLRDLQAVMAIVNHDMLHHFTSPYINSGTAFKGGTLETNRISPWAGNIPRTGGFGEAYEEWAQMGQEKIVLQPENAAMLDEVRARVGGYFDKLGRVRDALLAPKDGDSAEEKAAKEQAAHETVDYFGTVMAHALVRVFPLNHEIIEECLGLLEKTDPRTDLAMQDCHRVLVGVPPAETNSQAVLSNIRKKMSGSYGGKSKEDQVLAGYREAGLDVFPDDLQLIGYKNLKMVELIKLGDTHSHVPVIENEGLTKIRKLADELTLNMVAAAAKTVYKAPANNDVLLKRLSRHLFTGVQAG